MKRRTGTIWIAALLCFGLLGGCGRIAIMGSLGSQDVFRIGDKYCDLTEAKVYLANYQNIYGKSYGIDLWERKFKERELKEYIKEVSLSEMTRVACMDLLAEDQGIALTKEEKQAVKEAAGEYYRSLGEAELSYTGASEADIVSMYEDYALAHKVYRSLTVGVNEEVSDDEARIMEAMQIYVKKKKEVREVKAKLAAGEDFAAVASNYNQKAETELVFGRGTLPEEVEKAAFDLDNGEVSECVEAEDGFYFIKCINKFNEELTDANKSNIVETREKAAFDDVYEEFVGGLTSKLNEGVWEDVTLVTDGSITTDCFFDTIEGAMEK